MPSTVTHIAYCGACASRMVREETADGWPFYRCEDCGEETEPRATDAEAAEDVVWVPIKQGKHA
jgi:hypothetical protein